MKAKLLEHLTSEVKTLCESALTFRTRIAFIVWVGPYLLLGSALVATNGEVQLDMSWWAVVALALYVALGVAAGWIEMHYWRKCNEARELIAHHTGDNPKERRSIASKLIDSQNESWWLVMNYAAVFFLIAVSFVFVVAVLSGIRGSSVSPPPNTHVDLLHRSADRVNRDVAAPAREHQETIWRTISRVVDGDTLVLENDERVRLIGVDTPETKHPTKPVQYFGREASAFTKKMVEGKRVRLDFDQANAHVGHKDRYGRTLAYVYLPDGRMLNSELVRLGYGHAYTRFPFKYLEEFRQLEKEAREKGRGLWAPR